MDPEGPRRWRWLPYLLPLALFIGLSPSVPATSQVSFLVAFVAFNALGLLSRRQQAPRDAELVTGPGYVDVRGVGRTRSQRLFARDITGGTTARTRRGVLLTLQHRHRDQPITIELPTEAEVERVRLALGIGHGGFGTVAWRTSTDRLQRTAIFGRIAAILFSSLALVLPMLAPETGLLGLALGQFAFFGGLLGLVGLAASTREPTVVMGPEGLRIHTPGGWFALPYGAVEDIEVNPHAIVFKVPAPYYSVAVPWDAFARAGMSPPERDRLLSQIRAAAQRARGHGTPKEDVTGRLDALRRNGEPTRDWLARLDVAGQVLAVGTGYRGHVLEPEDLWAILEDPDAEPDLRTAAARILRNAPNTRVRIDAAVAAVRDDLTNRRLRVAVADDLDQASHELAMLDAEDQVRRYRAGYR